MAGPPEAELAESMMPECSGTVHAKPAYSTNNPSATGARGARTLSKLLPVFDLVDLL